MASRPQRDGPSRRLLAWWRFIIEAVLLCELIAVIAVVGLGATHNVFAGAAVGGLVAAVLRIVRSMP